jgi:hypothetical protein
LVPALIKRLPSGTFLTVTLTVTGTNPGERRETRDLRIRLK